MEINKSITGKTKLIGLIGNPIEHTISPQLHNTISGMLDIKLTYVPFRVNPEDLEYAVKGLKALNFLGFNVTVPYKKDVMKYLDENTREALLMGAVNTVKNIDGTLYGYNTDAEGFSRSFKEEAGTGFRDKTVLLIGAGGAARSIAVKIAFEGAKKLYIANRTLKKAQELASLINENVKYLASSLSYEDKDFFDIFYKSDIIINTTSAGMYPNISESPVDLNTCRFNSNQIVYDVIYNPLKTRFLSEAEKNGCKIINGLGMLLYQGIAAYEIWTGVKLPEDFVRDLCNLFKSEFLA